MAKPYRYLDHTADLGFEINGKTLAELFVNTGRALFETQINGTIKTENQKSMKLHGESLEDLYLDWCRELLFAFSADGFIPAQYEVTIEDLRLAAILRGEHYDPTRHRIRMEIKNPTYHELLIEQDEQGFHARIIFDV
jgi:SHS2 domain-containing protein